MEQGHEFAWNIGRLLLMASVLIVGLYFFTKVVVLALATLTLHRNRELTVIFAVVSGPWRLIGHRDGNWLVARSTTDSRARTGRVSLNHSLQGYDIRYRPLDNLFGKREEVTGQQAIIQCIGDFHRPCLMKVMENSCFDAPSIVNGHSQRRRRVAKRQHACCVGRKPTIAPKPSRRR